MPAWAACSKYEEIGEVAILVETADRFGEQVSSDCSMSVFRVGLRGNCSGSSTLLIFDLELLID
jgi:hypothetical protein